MTNREMINDHNNLYNMQCVEKELLRRTGKQLFGGRIRITYAMVKNMGTFKNALKPYEESRMQLISEYRDLEAEETARARREAAKEEAKKAGKEPEKEPEEWDTYIFREGKEKEEYIGKLNELLDIDIKDVTVHMVDPEEFDGLELSSLDLEPFMFMIR